MYHILICDDEQDIVNALKIYLMNPDFKLFEANTGVQALEVMEREDIHLILLDIMMPDLRNGKDSGEEQCPHYTADGQK